MDISSGQAYTIHVLEADGTLRAETSQTATDITGSGAPALKVTASGATSPQMMWDNMPSFPALPEASSGTWMDAGNAYTYGGSTVEVIQGHNRTEHEPSTVPALFRFLRQRGAAYEQPLGSHDAYNIGDVVTHEGIERTANIDGLVFSPDTTPQYWDYPEGYEPPETAEWAEGVAYSVNDEVDYLGTTYRCLQAHTSLAGWTPVAVPALWAVVA